MLVLGSGSAARKELLTVAGYKPDAVVAPDIDETPENSEPHIDYVVRMAVNKSKKIKVNQHDFLITADTIVVAGRKILHKTNDLNIARRNLTLLKGRRHKVYTAFCVRHQNKVIQGLEKTVLKMKFLNDQDIKEYLETKEWKNKAGAYSIQGIGVSLFLSLNGCYSNVVGLPIPKVISKLKGLGYKKRTYK